MRAAAYSISRGMGVRLTAEMSIIRMCGVAEASQNSEFGMWNLGL
jgi:hypothetical protein